MIPFASGAITLFFGLFFILVRMPILSLFTKDREVLLFAGRNVMIMLSCQWMYAVFNVISCIINGTGRVKYTTVINLLMLWAVRIPVAILISLFWDSRLIMLCFPVSFGFGLLCMLAYYAFSPSWKALMERGL